ncbi:enoyl-CoA hydratase/isomerase family protein [Paracoccus sp. SCSIO 75233]|uniref:enoyl-CoA hydratase/isomerase family protein n=1 Tax=Paracoccus sp. SCSIO 75233 TaxID=3017782 RepID=UPI0022F0F060|nr:enoyl-CoA hydratase/isomerase family protein [Paracoccus sp. SCSIO 75233]WBU53914.1 enoyl-CoA hydratase/isomerase family protein [Paracoccus sp. SCSIO 75233]
MIKQYPHVETERDGSVLIIRLDNAGAKNALTREMRYSLRDIVREIEDDRSVRAVYLTAKGDAFCAGGDLNMLINAHQPWEVHRRFRHANRLFPPLMTLDRPVVCGVKGYAVGGGMGLALCADVIIAAESAQFMSGFYRLGVVPDCMALFTLPRLVGLARARNFLLTNGTWSAKEAADLGVAAKVVPDADLDAEGLALAQKLASGPAEIMGLSKLIMLKSFEKSIDDMMLYEDLGQSLAMSGAEFNEGLDAVSNRRKPDHAAAAAADPTNDGLPDLSKPVSSQQDK